MPLCLGKVFTLKFAFSLLALLFGVFPFTPLLLLQRHLSDWALPAHSAKKTRGLCICKRQSDVSEMFAEAVGWRWAFKPDARRQPSPLLPSCTSFPALRSYLGWWERRWSSHSTDRGRCFPKLFHQAREGATWNLCSFSKCFPGNMIKTYLAWSHTVSYIFLKFWYMQNLNCSLISSMF